MAMPNIAQGMVYPLPGRPRFTVRQVIEENEIAKGLAIIIGNQCSTVRHYKDLIGPIQDIGCMTYAFRLLEYAVLPMPNASRQDILDMIADVSQYFPCDPNRVKELCYERFVFVFAGHGDDTDSIHTHDGTVDLRSEVIWPLLPGQAQHLREIPKLFFIDACRAPIQDAPVSRGGGRRLPDMANYMLVHSTQPTQEAMETSLGGDWMQILAREICNQANLGKTINEILIQINEQLNKQLTEAQRLFLQQPIEMNTLQKNIKFLDEAIKLQEMYYPGRFSWSSNVPVASGPPQSCLQPPLSQFATPNYQTHPYPSQEPITVASNDLHGTSVYPGYVTNWQDLESVGHTPVQQQVHTAPAPPIIQSDQEGGRGGAGLPTEGTKTSTSSKVSKSTQSSIEKLENLLIEMHGPSPSIDYSMKETGRGFKAIVHAPLIGYAEGEECSTETKAKRSAATKAIEKLRSVD